MAKDVFPQTMSTWIGETMRRGTSGRLELNRHLMETYAEPLRIYYLGTNSRWIGEPDEVVAGFFASRLGQERFLEKWQASGMRLRRWLMNAFCYYLHERKRELRRNRHAATEDLDEPVTYSGDPHAAVDRAMVTAFVRRALDEAQRACLADGLTDHWQIFVRHRLHGAPFAEIAPEFGVDKARAAVMSRTAGRKFRSAVRDVLMRDGVPEEEIDQEIECLLEVSGT